MGRSCYRRKINHFGQKWRKSYSSARRECLGLEVSFAAKSLDEVGFFKERFRNSLSWVLIEQWPDPVTAHNRCATSKVSLFLSSSGSEMAVQSGGDGGWVLVAISSFIVNKSSIVDRISILLSDGIAESIKPAWQITLPFSSSIAIWGIATLTMMIGLARCSLPCLPPDLFHQPNYQKIGYLAFCHSFCHAIDNLDKVIFCIEYP